MPKPRRTLAAALVIGASAIALTGCLPLPPELPTAPAEPPIAESTPSAAEPAPSTEPAPSAEPDAPTADYPFTVDDDAGDTWSFDVTGLIADPPLEAGEAEDGTYLVGVLLSAEHLDGTASFTICFDIFVEGDDGETYDWSDTLGVTAENDIYYADDDAFTDAVAAVQLPEGVEPARVIVRSSYGYPEAPDTVITVD